MTSTDEMPIDETRRRRARLQFVLVAAAFLGTPLVATLLYAYGDKGHHGDTVNKGVLVDPPRPVDGAAALGLLDRWTLVVVAPSGCDAGCERTLTTLRQVRLTLGHDVDRVGRLLVSGAAADAPRLAPAHPDLGVLDAGQAGALIAVTADLAEGPTAAGQGGRAFLVDPLGNLMMTYAPDPAPKDVQSDLKRLLKNSETWMRQ
jgi:hypothetical protein